MFGFANGLLLLLLAAAVIDFAPVVRRRLSPASWWNDERLLFTPRGGDLRQKYGAWAFLLGVMVYEFLVVFNNSMARENWPWLQTRVSPVLDWVIYLCFGAKILLGTKYNGRSILCAGMLYFVARWVYFNGQNIWWLGLCVALLAAKDVPLRRVMKAFLASGVPTLTLVQVLHFAGIIAPNAASERDGSYRLMFGYGHPNTFGGVVLVAARQRLCREVSPIHIMYEAFGRGHAVQRVIVEHHQPPVRRKLHIQLDAVAILRGGGKGGQAVLRRALILAKVAAVGTVMPHKRRTQGIPALIRPDGEQHQQHQNQHNAKQDFHK